ncbi:MAG: DUF3592 domain-containing protein [Bacteroidales bacterium]|nr:DUF3592 domain-containing protein [Bacteroidales bacterium]
MKKNAKTKQDSVFRLDGFSLIIFRKKFHFIHILLIMLSIYFLTYSITGTVNRKKLAENGEVTQGYVYDIISKGSKGVKDYKYRFNVNGRTYYGFDIYAKKEIGDSVQIMYLPDNPKENKLLDRLIKNDMKRLRKNTLFQKEIKKYVP